MKMEEPDYHEWIENYFDGQLSEGELQRFNQLLSTNREFAELFQLRSKVSGSWQAAKEYNETKRLVSSIGKKINTSRNPTVSWFYIAATVLLIISLSAVFIGYLRNKNKTEIGYQLPTINTDEIKASIHHFDQFSLISPAENKSFSINDSIVFTWNSQVDTISFIIIENGVIGKEIFRDTIHMEDHKYILKSNSIPAGNYTWSIAGFTGKEIFRITL